MYVQPPSTFTPLSEREDRRTAQPVGGWEYDSASDTVRGTEELYDTLGLPDETQYDLDAWLQFYLPKSRLEVRTAIEQCIDEGGSFDLEVSLLSAETSDGRRAFGEPPNLTPMERSG